MNKNIEVINENLWGVNFHHLHMIQDLEYSGSVDEAASLTNDGIIVLNAGHELYQTFKLCFQRMMAKTDKDLDEYKQYMKDKNRDGYDIAFKYCVDAEIKRRQIAKKSKKRSRDQPLIKRILNLIKF